MLNLSRGLPGLSSSLNEGGKGTHSERFYVSTSQLARHAVVTVNSKAQHAILKKVLYEVAPL